MACATPSAPAPQPPEQQGAAPTAPRVSRTLVAIARVAPAQLAAKSLAQTGVAVITTNRVFNAGLALMSDHGQVLPYLADTLPDANTDSWRIDADGRMETTYRLKPGLTWHDGTRLTAEDFAFAFRVYSSREFGVAAAPPINQIEDVLAPDPQTVLIRWQRTYPNAARLFADQFQALPMHILDEPFRSLQPDAFLAHPFWSAEYVGLGPYRVERYDPGSAIDAVAFPGHALGAPKIDRLRVQFIPDANTAVANLMSGAGHVTFDEGIRLQQGVVLRREWAARNAGTVLVLPGLWRFVQVQLHPERVNPRALLDVRVRRALAYTLDREAVNLGVYEGEAPPSLGVIPPTVDYYAEIERSVIRYDYDPRRGEQLMTEAGYGKASDGTYTRSGEGPLTMELRVSAGSQNEAEQAIMASVWRSNGFGMTEVATSTALEQSPESRAMYPALRGSNTTPGEDTLTVLGTVGTPRPENRWFGTNRGSWSNEEYDRLVDAFNTTVDRAQRIQQIVRMVRIMSEDLPAIPLNFTPYAVAVVAPLRGVTPVSPDNQITWNIHQWELL